MKKIKLSLLELHGHSEVLRSFYYALKEYQLFVFSTKEGIEKCSLGEDKNLTTFIQTCGVSVPEFIFQNKEFIDNSDWIIFITIEKHFRFFARQSWNAKTLLVIHNGNYWLNYYQNIKLKCFKDVVGWLKAEFFRHHHFREQLLQSVNFVTFPNNTILNFFIERKLIDYRKIFPILPFFMPAGEKKAKHESLIVIPGTIKKETRDYMTVYKAFQGIEKRLEKSIQLVLLGKPKGGYGKRIKAMFDSLSKEKIEVTSYSSEVPLQDYEDLLSKANFLILPLKETMYYGICKEIGGLTKISGGVNDMIRFEKPALIAKGYHLELEYANQVSVYENADDLSMKILEWVNNDLPSFPPYKIEYLSNWIKYLDSDTRK